MGSRRKHSLLIIFLTVFTSFASAQISTPQISRISAQSDGTILINWTIGSENGVDHYIVSRSTSINGTFTPLDYKPPKGTLYFIDKSDLFKTTGKYFCYTVTAVGSGESQTSSVMGLVYDSPSSTAKRTWGSIKAMFR
jgi:hypothetical protein